MLTASANSVVTPTPSEVLFHVTTKDGQKLQLNSLDVGIDVKSTMGASFHSYKGIPTQHGIFVSFDYIDKVEIGDDSNGVQTVVINLVDGNILQEKLRPYGYAIGKTELGDFKKSLPDIKLISIQRKSEESMSIPQTLPSEVIATVVYTDSHSIDLANPGML